MAWLLPWASSLRRSWSWDDRSLLLGVLPSGIYDESDRGTLRDGVRSMRTFSRWLLGLVGTVVILVGVAVGAAAWSLDRELSIGSGEWVLSTPREVVSVPGCSTVLFEVSNVAIDPGELARVPSALERSKSVFVVEPTGDTPSGWWVGTVDSSSVEARLLGARYCIVSSSDGEWSTTSIAVEEGSPDVSVDGLDGRWALADSGAPVILPVPEPGDTVIVSGNDANDLESVALAVEYRIADGSTLGLIGLIGGALTSLLGLLVLVIATWGLRRRGRHEDRS